MSDRIRAMVEDGRVHLLDGAMGTMLYERGVFVNICYDELCITAPDLVREVHAAYVDAGAEAVETNTFGANPVKLSAYGLEARTEEINRAAALLAVQATRDRAGVLGAVGPLGIRIEPWGPTAREDAEALFGRQIDGLLEGGVQGFVLETFADPDELHCALRAVRARSDLPVFAQMTVGNDGRTAYGSTPDQIVDALTEWGADVIGLNCSVGPAVMLDAIERMAERATLPLSAQPNAGIPRTVGDRTMYLASPDYIAGYARRLIETGVRFVGGCCGTTPDHIRRMRDQVAHRHPRIHGSAAATPPRFGHVEDWDPVPLARRSRLGGRLARKEFATLVELVPPRGWDPQPLLARARRLADAGVDAAVITDGASAGSRMGAVPTAALLASHEIVDTVAHYTCRDRNMAGMVHDLLGAAASGVRNLLISTGDPSTLGPYPDSRAVFDIDSIGLTNVLYHLNQGRDPGGSSIGRPTEFVIGVAVRPAPVDPDDEAERLRWKVEAGADFVLAGPVFDTDTAEAVLTRLQAHPLPVILAVQPLLSLRNAEHLAHEVPGLFVPEPVLERMRDAQSRGPDAAIAEGVALATEAALWIRRHAAGMQIRAPSGRVDVAVRVLDGVRGPARTA